VAPKLTSLAFALPAYNESDGIAEFLGELDQIAHTVTERAVFVVADDCSSDRTREVVEKAATSLSGEVVLEPGMVNSGHGPTVLRAYEAALGCQTEAVFQVDGDGQFEADDVVLLVAALESGADVVTGRRITRVDPWFRKLLTWMLRQLLRYGFGVRRRDANCPFRLYRADALRSILSRIPPDAAVPHVMMTVVEERLDLTTVEVDVRHRVRRGDDATGTMWQSTRMLVVPWRLVSFSAGALTELLRFRRTL
jgi:glycosyltransferase involved in cell wall biosynthesis